MRSDNRVGHTAVLLWVIKWEVISREPFVMVNSLSTGQILVLQTYFLVHVMTWSIYSDSWLEQGFACCNYPIKAYVPLESIQCQCYLACTSFIWTKTVSHSTNMWYNEIWKQLPFVKYRKNKIHGKKLFFLAQALTSSARSTVSHKQVSDQLWRAFTFADVTKNP